jgi:hypothetical protein
LVLWEKTPRSGSVDFETLVKFARLVTMIACEQSREGQMETSRELTRSVSLSAVAFCVGMSAITLVAIGFKAHAISSYTSTSMTCASIKAKIQSEGAAILHWRSSQGNPRYDRYVANSSYCDWEKRAVIAYVPSSDRKSCAVKNCRRCDRDDKLPFPFRPC